MNEKLELAAAMLQWLDAMATWGGSLWRIEFNDDSMWNRTFRAYDSLEEIVEDLTTVPDIEVGDVVISRINGRSGYEVLDIDRDFAMPLAQLCLPREKMIGGRMVEVREPYDEWIPLVFLKCSS